MSKVGNDPQTNAMDGILVKLNSDMTEVLPGLYIGTRRNASSEEQLRKFNITRIFAIHDRPGKKDCVFPFVRKYRFIEMSDTIDAKIINIFSEANRFIHEGRICGENVLVHCLMGQSRSVAIVAAYISTVHRIDGPLALQFLRLKRKQANPNIGFILQLNRFAKNISEDERTKLLESNESARVIEIDQRIIKECLPFAI